MEPFLSAQTMRLILLIVLFQMLMLAAFYLRQRQLSLLAYIGWGLLALLAPALGPFLVIVLKPGQPTRKQWASPAKV